MFETGLADILGKCFISLGGNSAGLGLITFLSITLSVLLTEVTSNTASANMIIPIIIAISKAASLNPVYPVLGSALACSFAFLLPVATPPNAIIFGSGMIRIPQMLRYGIKLEIVGIILIWGYINLILPTLGIL